MKRIIPITLICVILVLSMAPAAFASDTMFIELLDIASANGADNNKIYYQAGHGYRAAFNFESVWQVEYVDILFLVSHGASVNSVIVSLNGLKDNGNYLNVVHVAGDLYRAYGYVSGNTRTLYCWLDLADASWAIFQSFRVSTNPLEGYDETGQAIVMAYGFNEVINYVPTDTINHRSFVGASSPELNYFDSYITPHNWQKYDFFDIIFQADLSSINAISACLGDASIPYTVSYLNSGETIHSHYEVAVRLDLRELDRTSTDYFYIHVEGAIDTGSDNLFGILGMRGYVRVASIDSDTVWYRRFYKFLKDDFYFNVRSALDNILIALSPSSSSGDAFKEESSDMISGLDGISSSMDSVARPSMDSLDVDFSGDISNASVLMSGLFTEVTSVPWLSTIILASCSIGLLSYVLFGKE